jgi:hypothetical protein
MRVKAEILLIMGLLLLVGTVAAADNSFHIPDKEWVVANGIDQSTITVQVSNDFGIKDGLATVKFTVDPLYGTMDPAIVLADPISGIAESIFYVNTKSGTAIITANITYTENPNIPVSVELPISQKIDHDIPFIPPFFDHPHEGTISNQVHFNMSFKDRWGNLIDNKTGEVHMVQLTVYGPDPNDCYFVGPNIHDITLPLDSNGILSANLKLTSKPGSNNIVVRPQWTSISIGRTINAVANGVPFRITQVYDPPGNPPSLPADGNEKFTIKYVLYDQFENPTSNQSVGFNNGIADQTSNSEGEVWIEYGPSDTIKDINIIATAVQNSSVTVHQTVRFYNQLASNFDINANPKIMASLDANPNTKAYITAKVVDGNGFPVQNQFVSFVIKTGSISYPGGPYNVTVQPNLTSLSATTNEFGSAVVVLKPGAFSKIKTDLNYSGSATGSCVVSANWSGIIKDTDPIIWKNYPYLTVITNTSPKVVNVNETVDVRVLLNGDGFGYAKKPIDVALVIDRSGSMADTMSGKSKLYLAQTAAISFINQMDNTTDRLGVVSYSGSSGAGARIDTSPPLTTVFNDVTGAINGLTAKGATESREAFKMSIELLNASPNPNPKAVQAVIFLTDGDYNLKGNPLGRGTGWPQGNPDKTFSTSSLEPNDYLYYNGLGGTLTEYTSGTCSNYSTTVCDNYENSCNVCAPGYTLGTGSRAGQCQWTAPAGHPNHNWYTPNSKPSSCTVRSSICDTWHCDSYIRYKCTNGYDTNQNMANYANSKNIRIYTIGFASGLTSQAVQDMKYLAESTGGFYRNASTGADLTSVYAEIAGDLKSEAAVNTSMSLDFGTITVNNAQINGVDVFSYVANDSTSLTNPGSTWIHKYNKTATIIPPYTIDDTANWTTKNGLSFDVGTIKLNETWETNFRLKVLREGNIEIFGPTSVIEFTDSLGSITTITLPNTSISARQVATNVNEKTIKIENLQPTVTPITHSIPMGWTTKYDGNSTVTERVYYSYNNGPWYPFNLQTGILNGTTVQTASLEVSGSPSGNYWIKVVATSTSGDAAMVYKTYGPIPVVGKGIFIKLE